MHASASPSLPKVEASPSAFTDDRFAVSTFLLNLSDLHVETDQMHRSMLSALGHSPGQDTVTLLAYAEQFVFPEDMQVLKQQVAHAQFADADPSFRSRFELRMKDADGEPQHFLFNVRFQHENVLRFQVQNISDLKRPVEVSENSYRQHVLRSSAIQDIQQLLLSSKYEDAAGLEAQSLQELLRVVSDKLGLERVQVYRMEFNLEHSRIIARRMHEPSVKGALDDLLPEIIDMGSPGLARWLDHLSAGEPVYGNTSSFNTAERAVLSIQMDASVWLFPLMEGERCLGFIYLTGKERSMAALDPALMDCMYSVADRVCRTLFGRTEPTPAVNNLQPADWHQNAHVLMVITDMEGEIVHVHGETCRHFLQNTAPEDAKFAFAPLHWRMANGEMKSSVELFSGVYFLPGAEFTATLIFPEGEERLMRVNATKTECENPEEINWVYTCVDIQEIAGDLLRTQQGLDHYRNQLEVERSRTTAMFALVTGTLQVAQKFYDGTGTMEALKSMELRTAVIAEMLRLNTSYAATLPVSAWMDILQVQMKEKVWPDSLSVDWMSDHNDLKLSGPVSLSMVMVASEFLLLSAKRGLVDMSSAVLYFSTSRRGDYILLEMADNGKGWQLEEATGSESGFSYALIHAYAASLGGAATFEVQNGMKMLVTFPV